MPLQDQLEIINPSGALDFHTLDASTGVTNLGRSTANDIVLDGVQVADFSVVLDHREKPYRVMALTEIGAPSLSGEAMAPNRYYEIHDWESVEVGGFSIVLLEDHSTATDASAAAAVVAATTVAAATDEAETAAAPVVAAIVDPEEYATVIRPASGNGNQPFADLDSETIVVEMSQREVTTDVEQRATWDLTVINGGPIVAAFQVHIEGWIDDCWVAVVPDHANLFEGARADFTVSVSPPRQPSSRAGVHYIALVVTSPNYPGERTQRAATLIINPYTDFRIGDLSPRSRSISYFTHGAKYELSIQNLGNDEEMFHIQGSDDQAGVSFEFEVPGEEVALARQADVELEPAQEIVLPISVTPNRRKLIGARRHDYSLTVTTGIRESSIGPRSVLGILGKRPLIGPWVITALMVLAAILALIIFSAQDRIF
ncbi:MAG: hypothetical protein HC802_16935 [Caldilineaceae bacterium]|nr:hypothetical protein [Caldilineaceae bacterium]